MALNSLANSIQKLIEREDINGELRFVLDSETPYPYLQEQIQKLGDRDNAEPVGSEQHALKGAFDYLRQQIELALQAIDADTTLADTKKGTAKRKKLLGVRDKILRLQLIVVQVGTEDDSYLIFETMNTRGKDLTVSDLVKNHLTRLIKPPNKSIDATKDKWNSILELFDKNETPISVNRFLHHSWLSRKSYTTERKLFKEIKKSVTRASARSFLTDLMDDAKLYSQLVAPDGHTWTKAERDLADSIRALNVFRVVQPVPMMLSLLREYRDDYLSVKQVKRNFRALENFHAQFTGVTSQRTGGGTAFMFAASARLLLEAGSRDNKATVIREFVAKLRARVPSYECWQSAQVGQTRTREDYYYEELRGSSLRVLL